MQVPMTSRRTRTLCRSPGPASATARTGRSAAAPARVEPAPPTTPPSPVLSPVVACVLPPSCSPPEDHAGRAPGDEPALSGGERHLCIGSLPFAAVVAELTDRFGHVVQTVHVALRQMASVRVHRHAASDGGAPVGHEGRPFALGAEPVVLELQRDEEGEG